MRLLIFITLCFLTTSSCKSEIDSPRPELPSETLAIETNHSLTQTEDSSKEVPKADIEKSKITSSVVPSKKNTKQNDRVLNHDEKKIEAAESEKLVEIVEDVTQEVNGIDQDEIIHSEKPSPEPESIRQKDSGKLYNHDIWDQLLTKYVNSEGAVDYEGLKKEHARLKEYLDILANNEPQKDWLRAKTMAYWINAYNAHTVDLIIKNYPAKSITDLDGGNPWDVKRIKIGQKSLSLNNIEHDILRKEFKDPRIHFAVNCAAKSCPKLHNRAWTEQNLETNLESLTRSFVNNKLANKLTTDKVELSKIFEWYRSDFGDLITFLNEYSTIKVSSKAKVSHLEYNWLLNKQ